MYVSSDLEGMFGKRAALAGNLLEDGQEVVGRTYPAPRRGRGGSTGGCLAALGRLGQAATREAYLG